MSEPMSSRSAPQPLLELKDVWRSYNQGGSKLNVLTGASLTVRAGEMTALVGPSGAGKSALLNIAGLLEQPDSGKVFIDAVDSGRLRQGNAHCCAASILALYSNFIGCCQNFLHWKM